MKPTRKTKTTETVLDLILANDKKKVLTLGVVDRQISDHSLVYTVLRSSLPCGRSRKVWYWSVENFSRNDFLHDMPMVPWHVLDVFDDVNKLYAFEQLLLTFLTSTPLWSKHTLGVTESYLWREWCQTIRHHNRLWKKFIRRVQSLVQYMHLAWTQGNKTVFQSSTTIMSSIWTT